MIEVTKRNEFWELYVDGGLLTWDEDIEVVVNYLHGHIDDIKQEMEDE